MNSENKPKKKIHGKQRREKYDQVESIRKKYRENYRWNKNYIERLRILNGQKKGKRNSVWKGIREKM